MSPNHIKRTGAAILAWWCASTKSQFGDKVEITLKNILIYSSVIYSTEGQQYQPHCEICIFFPLMFSLASLEWICLYVISVLRCQPWHP